MCARRAPFQNGSWLPEVAPPEENGGSLGLRPTWYNGGAETFGPRELLYAPVRYELERTTEPWLGDYIGLSFAAAVALVAVLGGLIVLPTFGSQYFVEFVITPPLILWLAASTPGFLSA